MKFKKLKEEEINSFISLQREKRMNKCKFCMSTIKLSNKSKPHMIKCTWKPCGKKYNIWEGTIFYKLRISQEKVIKMLEMWMIKISKDAISYLLEINPKTYWEIMKKVSEILVPNYTQAQDCIGGNNEIVEIDEAKFGKRKYNRGHRVEGVWVLGMVERTGLKRIRLIIVDDRTKSTLSEKIKENIEPNTRIYTDGWKGYNGLDTTYNEHLIVNHSKEFKNKETGCHTNTIEGCWSGIKLHVPLRGRTKDKVNLYLVRYMLLKNESTHPVLALLNYLF
jgi:transposase-like protein